MRKSNFITGIVHLLAGIVCLLTALIFETKLDDMLSWFSGYCIMFGGLTLHRYLYWNSPRNEKLKQEILERETIDAEDELQIKIKDKAGRYTHTLGIYILCGAFILVGILGKLGILAGAPVILLCIGGYLAVLLIAEKLICKHISKKY